MSLFSPESCCVSCVSVSSWGLFCDRLSPLERQGTQVAAPAFPLFCLSVSETEGSVRSLGALHFSPHGGFSDGVLWTEPSSVPEGGR